MVYVGRLEKIANTFYFESSYVFSKQFDNTELGRCIVHGDEMYLQQFLQQKFVALNVSDYTPIYSDRETKPIINIYLGVSIKISTLESENIFQVIKDSDANKSNISCLTEKIYLYISSVACFCGPVAVEKKDSIKKEDGIYGSNFIVYHTGKEVFAKRKNLEDILEAGTNINSNDIFNYVLGKEHGYERVKIDENEIKQLCSFAYKKSEAKGHEQHHKYDKVSEIKRNLTGVEGELAIEKILGIKIIDYTIGDSKKYHVPDLQAAGYLVGIKTVEFGKAPIVFKNSYKPEIICVKMDDTTILVCGLALPHILNHYQSIDLVCDSNLRKRGTKTGFYGFHRLIHLKNLCDLDPWKV